MSINDIQVTWLVITEVRSESFRLVTEHHHYNARPIYVSGSYVRQVLFFIAECDITLVLCTMCTLCAYSKSGHHPHPKATFVPSFISAAPHIAKLARGEKSHTQSLTHPVIWCAGNWRYRFGIYKNYSINCNCTVTK